MEARETWTLALSLMWSLIDPAFLLPLLPGVYAQHEQSLGVPHLKIQCRALSARELNPLSNSSLVFAQVSVILWCYNCAWQVGYLQLCPKQLFKKAQLKKTCKWTHDTVFLMASVLVWQAMGTELNSVKLHCLGKLQKSCWSIIKNPRLSPEACVCTCQGFCLVQGSGCAEDLIPRPLWKHLGWQGPTQDSRLVSTI